MISFLLNFQETQMASFDELEQQAEQKIADRLGKYSFAALTVGVIAGILMVGWAVLLLSAGSLVGAVAAVGIAVVIFWLVALLRAARATP